MRSLHEATCTAESCIRRFRLAVLTELAPALKPLVCSQSGPAPLMPVLYLRLAH